MPEDDAAPSSASAVAEAGMPEDAPLEARERRRRGPGQPHPAPARDDASEASLPSGTDEEASGRPLCAPAEVFPVSVACVRMAGASSPPGRWPLSLGAGSSASAVPRWPCSTPADSCRVVPASFTCALSTIEGYYAPISSISSNIRLRWSSQDLAPQAARRTHRATARRALEEVSEGIGMKHNRR